jgi:hypothetical protein
MRTRTDALREKEKQAEQSRFTHCAKCKVRQIRAVDGKCIMCGVEYSGAAPEIPPPPDVFHSQVARLEESKESPKPTLEPGVFVLVLKQLGYDATLAWRDTLTPEQIRECEECIRFSGVNPPACLYGKFLGVGKVPGVLSSLSSKVDFNPASAGEVERKDAEVKEVRVESPSMQPQGGEAPMTQIHQLLTNDGAKITLREIAAWSPEIRRQVADLYMGNAHPITRPSYLDPFYTKVEFEKHKVAVGETSQVGNVVTATWGEEKFTLVPGSYSTCTVGSFTMQSTVRDGETIEAAFQRLTETLRIVAEAERDRKIKSFLQKLRASQEKN